MNFHYLPPVPVNVPSPVPAIGAPRVRKRPMDSLKFTFKDLKEAMSTRIAADSELSSSSWPNLQSALDAFLAEQGFAVNDVIASSLRASYQRHLAHHVATLVASGRKKPYIANRKSLIARWRRLLLELDRTSAASYNRQSPFQLALHEMLKNGRTVRGTALAAGVPLATLKRWVKGAIPNERSAAGVPRLEKHFGLPPGALTDLLPQVFAKPTGIKEAACAANTYRARLRIQSRDRYAIKEPSDELRAQWRELVEFKTATGLPRSGLDGRRLKRTANGQWSSTERPVKARTARRWYAFKGSRYVASADVNWTLVEQYVGWLMLPPDKGGKGLAADSAMSLTNFVRDDFMDDYIDWRIERSTVAHAGVLTLLSFAASLCNPATGFLAQQEDRFGKTFGTVPGTDWHTRCQTAHRHYTAKLKDLKPRVKRSRDPLAAVGQALELQNPLDAVADAVARMDAVRPLTGGVNEAVWARDRLMLKLLASNPLRDKNLRMLSYRADGSGQLRKVHGTWRICIDKEQFKNFMGAARHRDYNMPVRPEVWNDIERYLRDYRAMLAPAGSEYVFASSRGTPEPMGSLRRRFAIITKRHFAGCDGFGPHGMRHVVATSILKANPNDWNAAAWALHDLPETVEASYAHLRSDDAARWLEPAMAAPFSRMR